MKDIFIFGWIVLIAVEPIWSLSDERLKSLINALNDTEPRFRAEAADELGALGPNAKSAVPALMRALTDGNSSVRTRVARALGLIGATSEPAIPEMIKALHDESEYVSMREACAEALAKISPADPVVIQALEDSIHSKSSSVRAASVRSLGALGPTAGTSFPKIRKALDDKDYSVRAQAVKAISKVMQKPEITMPIFVDELSDNYAVRREAAFALGQLGPMAKGAIPSLTKALTEEQSKDGRPAAGWAISEALARIGGDAIPELIQLLRHRDATVRVWAVYALGKMGSGAEGALPQIVELNKDKSKAVRERAREAIERIHSHTRRNREDNDLLWMKQ